MTKVIKSGTKNQEPGLYREADADGNQIVNSRVITLRAGHALPPTHHGSGWIKTAIEE